MAQLASIILIQDYQEQGALCVVELCLSYNFLDSQWLIPLASFSKTNSIAVWNTEAVIGVWS